MEVFQTDHTDNPDQGNWDKKNEQGAQQAKEKVIKEIYEIKRQHLGRRQPNPYSAIN